VQGPRGQPRPPSSQPPPPVVQVPRGRSKHLIRPAGPSPGSSVAPGAVGPTGQTPPLSQAQSSSPAPSGKNKGIEGELKHLFFQMFQPLVVLL
jgi:hypothetical protein